MHTITETPITTAARRIARDVNATVAEVTTYYDTAGGQLGSHETGMWFVDAADAPVAAVVAAGRRGAARRMSVREAQDLLDAHAATGAAAGEAHAAWLWELECAREDAR